MLAIEDPGHVLFVLVISSQMNQWRYLYILVQVCGIRAPDAVWHHSTGRKKYHYFLDQPTSVTGAGRLFFCSQNYYRLKQYAVQLAQSILPISQTVVFCLNRDISFLCDSLAAQRQRIFLPPMPDRVTLSLQDSQKASQAQEKIPNPVTVPSVLRLSV